MNIDNINNISFSLRTCNGVENNIRCNNNKILINKGIYFCEEHGNLINSLKHSYIILNISSYKNKYNFYNYLTTDDYKRYISRYKVVPVYKKILYQNCIKLNRDIISYIGYFL